MNSEACGKRIGVGRVLVQALSLWRLHTQTWYSQGMLCRQPFFAGSRLTAVDEPAMRQESQSGLGLMAAFEQC